MIRMSEIRPPVYDEIWHDTTHPYVVIKGSRGSGKSCTIALWIIVKMMKLKGANTLVMRRYASSHRDSTYATLKWAIKELGVESLWKTIESPYEMVYLPYGTKIIFKGLLDGDTVTGVEVANGHLCWCWFDEASEIYNKEKDFDKVWQSIRGTVPKHLFKRVILTFNPWFDFWIKDRFFKGESKSYKDQNIIAMTTTYTDNKYLDDADYRDFEMMKRDNPRMYNVAGLGNWGIAEGLVFNNWNISDFNYDDIKKIKDIKAVYGLDFGFNNPTALICAYVSRELKEIYIYDEHYQSEMQGVGIADMLKYKGYDKSMIVADFSHKMLIEELRGYGISRIKKCRKGAGSVMNGIQFIQSFKIYVLTKCKNTITELSTYRWADENKNGKSGKALNQPVKENDHLLDALRYAMEDIQINKKIVAGRRI